MKPESKFWQEVKKNITGISFTRLESWASAGVPDLLCYNKNGKFFTIELKVTKGNSIRFSPHQISFHIKHPKNSFILKKALGPLSIKLYEGSQIMQLKTREPCACIAEGWTKVQEHLVNVT
jgi:Holliday junction resolvase